jgi:hypothetical protein
MKACSPIVAHELCAYCGSVLPRNMEGVAAWRVGSRFVCNEFCADGIPLQVAARTSSRRSIMPARDIAGRLEPFGIAAIKE